MADDQSLVQHLIDAHKRVLDSNAEMGKSLYQVHGVVSSIHERQEHFIQAHASYVRETDAVIEEHGKRIDVIDLYAAGIKAQIRLVMWVVSLVGATGMVAALASLVKAMQ